MTDDTRLPRFGALLSGITALNLWLVLYHLTRQPACTDDFGVALSALNYLESGQLGPTMWNHPPLRNILVFLSMDLFGTGVAGVKLWSMLFGILSVPLLGGIVRLIFRDDRAALLAAFFLAIDPLFINFARQGINDDYLVFFPLAGIWLALNYLARGRAWLLVLAGVGMGGGLASKLSVLCPLLVTIILCLCCVWRSQGLSRRKKTGESLFVGAALCLVPFLIYLVTFFPWFGRGYGVPEWVTLQRQMLLETATHAGYNPATINRDKRAAEWFVRPVGHATYILPAGVRVGEGASPAEMQHAVNLLGMGNPLVWLLTLPATFFFLWRACRKRDPGEVFAVALFLAAYLPFVLASRPIWVNTALAVIPYAFILVAGLLGRMAHGRRFASVVLPCYLAVVLLTSAPLYILAIGEGGNYGVFRGILAHYAPGHGGGAPVAPASHR